MLEWVVQIRPEWAVRVQLVEPVEWAQQVEREQQVEWEQQVEQVQQVVWTQWAEQVELSQQVVWAQQVEWEQQVGGAHSQPRDKHPHQRQLEMVQLQYLSQNAPGICILDVYALKALLVITEATAFLKMFVTV